MVGLGGLGHMGVKFARAFGAHVVVFTTSPARRKTRCGSAPTRSSSPPTLSRWLSTPAPSTSSSTRSRPITTSTPTSTCSVSTATSPLVGAPEKPFPGLRVRPALRSQERLGFAHRRHRRDPGKCSTSAAEHGITADVEVIPIQQVNEAYERMLKSDVKYRFSIDMASLKAE